MGCLFGCLALAFPRIALVFVWLFGGGYLGRAYDSVLWPILGFFFLPLTTMTFAYSSNSMGAPGEVTPFGWLLTIVAVLVDLGLVGNGGAQAKRRRRLRKKACE